jgi:hypothetical protein
MHSGKLLSLVLLCVTLRGGLGVDVTCGLLCLLVVAGLENAFIFSLYFQPESASKAIVHF